MALLSEAGDENGGMRKIIETIDVGGELGKLLGVNLKSGVIIRGGEDNPLWEMKAFAYQGVVIQEPVAKMRAMTLSGLCLFISVTETTWQNYRKNEDFLVICNEVEKYIYNQKFAGAAADTGNDSATTTGIYDGSDAVSMSLATVVSCPPRILDSRSRPVFRMMPRRDCFSIRRSWISA